MTTKRPWSPARLADEKVQAEILAQVMKQHPRLTREETLEMLQEAGG
jgi:hypothetical protein